MGTFSLELCSVCGWWQVRREVYSYEETNLGFTDYQQAIIKNFDLSSKDAPLRALADYIAGHGDNIYMVHHAKMEELVGAVFREHLDCEVIHCGQTGDRGIDLLLVLSDELIPVQVKRRKSAGKIEPVATVREMLGVMYRDGYRKSYIVSTAERYSPSGTLDVSTVIAKGLADMIELIDRDRFLAILRSYFHSTTLSYVESAKELVAV